MSGGVDGVIKWSFWIGLGLIAVAVLARALDLIPVTVIAGILGLLTIGFAGYGALDEAASRSELRRRAAKVKREREREAAEREREQGR